MEPNFHVPLPALALREETPVSTAFDDVYFSRAGGIAETEHVFLAGNGLPARFVEKERFSVVELGFGTGLNFLVTWQAFLREAPPHHQLHYCAVEQFPLTPEMLRRVLALQPALAGLADALIAAYPLRLPGWHGLDFGRVRLMLGFGPAENLLPDLDTPVDAWYLDGFSPAKNPGLWTPEILQHLNRLSAEGATAATFTAAGAVKRELAAQGFSVSKQPGYGKKRDMLVAQRQMAATAPALLKAKRECLVIGGGIAGATVAYALAERGMAVTLLERATAASGASGNPAAVLFPQLTKRYSKAAAWYMEGYSHMLGQLRRWREAGLAFECRTPGMLRLPRHEAEEAQLQQVEALLGLDASIVQWLGREAAAEKAGVMLTSGGAYFPQGSWLDAGALCRALLSHPTIQCHTHTEVTECYYDGARWQVNTAAGATFTAPYCVLAAAHETAMLMPNAGLKLNAVAGQISLLPKDRARDALQAILCRKGYLIPCDTQYVLGATYRHDLTSLAVTAEDEATNLAELEDMLPGWRLGQAAGGRVSIRATTPDRLPYVGALGENLWVTTGHGSRGMLSAPLAAETIAAEICGEQVPLTRALREAVQPKRF